MQAIADLLAEREVELDGAAGDDGLARRRAALTRHLGACYPELHRLRLHLVGGGGARRYVAATGAERDLLAWLLRDGLVAHNGADRYRAADADAIRYLNGGWLEEFAYLAACAAGAEAASFAQTVRWRAAEFAGANEIDVIARHGRRLLFVSCKLAQPWIGEGSEIRAKLRGYLNEAAAMARHFATPDHTAVLMVSTDLLDEARGDAPRYAALFGKAHVLDVDLVGLDHFRWDMLVARFRELLEA
ncbi:MAG: DUF1887 family CARF protein [Thalassobaculaceae bacterium]